MKKETWKKIGKALLAGLNNTAAANNVNNGLDPTTTTMMKMNCIENIGKGEDPLLNTAIYQNLNGANNSQTVNALLKNKMFGF